MLSLRRPSNAAIAAFLDTQRATGVFSYPEVGATRGNPPARYTVDHNRVLLGHGEAAFLRAIEAVRAWRMFAPVLAHPFPERAPIELGTTVAIVAHHFGFWSLNACRIVYVLDEPGPGPVRRFGFAYGTLAEHVEQGEERFSVEHHASDDSVWYDLLAFSRPRHWLARVARPVARSAQRAFVAASLGSMLLTVAGLGEYRAWRERRGGRRGVRSRRRGPRPLDRRIEATAEGAALVDESSGERSWSFLWSEVEEVVAWKADLLTTDCICITFVLRDRPDVMVDEETRGWMELGDRLLVVLGVNVLSRHAEIAFPAFAENRTVLWRRAPGTEPGSEPSRLGVGD